MILLEALDATTGQIYLFMYTVFAALIGTGIIIFFMLKLILKFFIWLNAKK